MKYLVQTACAAALIGLSGNVYAAQNGINYDPVHNPAWEPARKKDDFNSMNKIFDQDLTQIKKMGFNTSKPIIQRFAQTFRVASTPHKRHRVRASKCC